MQEEISTGNSKTVGRALESCVDTGITTKYQKRIFRLRCFDARGITESCLEAVRR